MRRSIFLGVAFALFGTALANIGCGKKETPATGDSPLAPAPNPGPELEPKPSVIPPDQITYDPLMPEIKIDLAKFSSALLANDPSVKEWVSKNGKVAEVVGIMGSFSVNQKTGRETFILKSETGDASRAMGCELQALPDWRQVSPGRRLKVVGILDVKDYGPRGIDIRLNHATIVTVSGDKLTPDLAAKQIGEEYAASPSAFGKKWKVEDKFYLVTGTLKEVEQITLSGGEVANKFRIAAGPVDLYCNILNGRGVNADPPKTGDKVTLLLECFGYSPGYEAIAMTGAYAGKGR